MSTPRIEASDLEEHQALSLMMVDGEPALWIWRSADWLEALDVAREMGLPVACTSTVAEELGFDAANPTAPPPARIVQWGRRQPYSLGELREWVPRWFRSPRPPVSALGRNCGLFCSGMKWAGRRANEHCSVLAMLTATNEASYPNPLPWAEVAHSIERYRRQWIASGWAHRPAWLERQRARGAEGGQGVSGRRRRAQAALAAERAHELRSEGLPAAAIAEELRLTSSPA